MIRIAVVGAVTVLAAIPFSLPAQPPTPPAGAQPPAQTGGRAGRGAPGRGGGGFANAFPQRTPDPAAVERGKALYGVHCNFCHGSDARGGEGGPNLLRSEVVLNDQNGEAIAPIVQNGRGDMPKLPLTNAQVADVAAYVHSFRVSGYDASRNPAPSIVVGDAKAGQAYFQSKCASCHNPTGDLKGIATRFADPKALQQRWLIPSGGGRGARGGGGTPVTATVSAPGGDVTGRLVRIDDFIVTIQPANGPDRTFRRDGDSPKVEIHDPVAPHRNLLPTYSDTDIHNVTAYLVTLK